MFRSTHLTLSDSYRHEYATQHAKVPHVFCLQCTWAREKALTMILAHKKKRKKWSEADVHTWDNWTNTWLQLSDQVISRMAEAYAQVLHNWADVWRQFAKLETRPKWKQFWVTGLALPRCQVWLFYSFPSWQRFLFSFFFSSSSFAKNLSEKLICRKGRYRRRSEKNKY